jgi:hypothetical protein
MTGEGIPFLAMTGEGIPFLAMTGEGISSLTSIRDKPRNDNTGFTEDLPKCGGDYER